MRMLLVRTFIFMSNVSTDQADAWAWRSELFSDVAKWLLTGTRWRDIRDARKKVGAK